jgi:hypothetical protein
LEYFIAICYILWQYGSVWPFGNFFQKNLATLFKRVGLFFRRGLKALAPDGKLFKGKAYLP